MLRNYTSKQIKKKTGFTLAEVLVTLAIIGVVASLTILTLIHNSENQKTVAGVKKAYSVLSQVYTSFITDDVDMDTVFAGDGQHVGSLTKFIAKMNIIKNCGIDTGCFPDVTYTTLDGNNWTNINQNNARAKVILADGFLITLRDLTGGCSNPSGTGVLVDTCGSIIVDINGFKGPNQMGRDTFAFWVTKSGPVPFGSNGDAYVGDCTIPGTGNSCTTKVITEGAVNY